MRKGATTDTGATFADRNELAANFFSVARVVCNMHDALLLEQRRTNQLLEALIVAQGGDVPDPAPVTARASMDDVFDPATGEPIRH